MAIYLKLVSVEVTGDHHALSSDNNDLVSVEGLLGHNSGKSTEKVTGAINDLLKRSELLIQSEIVPWLRRIRRPWWLRAGYEFWKKVFN